MQETSNAAKVQIRLAKPEDAATIAKLLYEPFAEFEPLYTGEGFAATTPQPEQVLVRMKEGPVWIAFLEREPLGTVAAVAKGESLYMRGMAVLPGARGLGIGAQLLDQVMRFAADQGHTRILLSTTPFLQAAIRLYERHSFRQTDSGPRDLFGTPLFTMERDSYRSNGQPGGVRI